MAITGSRYIVESLRRYSDDRGSQGFLPQVKQECGAIDCSTHTTINARKQTNSYLVDTIFIYIERK